MTGHARALSESVSQPIDSSGPLSSNSVLCIKFEYKEWQRERTAWRYDIPDEVVCSNKCSNKSHLCRADVDNNLDHMQI